MSLRFWRRGSVSLWLGRSDHEHPSRWVGFHAPLIGEVELHLTSNRIHRHMAAPRLDVFVDAPEGLAASQIARRFITGRVPQ